MKNEIDFHFNYSANHFISSFSHKACAVSVFVELMTATGSVEIVLLIVGSSCNHQSLCHNIKVKTAPPLSDCHAFVLFLVYRCCR